MFEILYGFLVASIFFRCRKHNEIMKKMEFARTLPILATFLAFMLFPAKIGVNNPWIAGLTGAIAFLAIFFLRELGTSLIALGAFSNFLAKTLNSGHMPVSTEAARQFGMDNLPARHIAMNGQTQLPFLADIFPVPLIGVMSLGDILLLAGLITLSYKCQSIRPSFNDLLLAKQ